MKVIFNHWLKDLFGSKTQIELFYSMNLDSLNRSKSVAPVCATLMVLPRSNGWRVLEHICWGQRDKIIVVRSLPIAIDRTVNRAPRKCVEPRCWFIVRVSIYFYDHRINLTEDGHVFWLCTTPVTIMWYPSLESELNWIVIGTGATGIMSSVIREGGGGE